VSGARTKRHCRHGRRACGRLFVASAAGQVPQKWVDGFYGGLMKLASRHGVPLAGGDMRKRRAVLAIGPRGYLVLGSCPRARRFGAPEAKPGDSIALALRSLLRMYIARKKCLNEKVKSETLYNLPSCSVDGNAAMESPGLAPEREPALPLGRNEHHNMPRGPDLRELARRFRSIPPRSGTPCRLASFINPRRNPSTHFVGPWPAALRQKTPQARRPWRNVA